MGMFFYDCIPERLPYRPLHFFNRVKSLIKMFCKCCLIFAFLVLL